VVHCDLKPANVIDFGRRGWKLTDFGIAWSLEQDPTDVSASSGTLAFMAPEQLEGRVHDLGPPTDLYALGCLAWRKLTDAHPFTRAQVLAPERGRPGVFVANTELPVGVEAWIRVLLQPDPRDRFSSAAAAARALVAVGGEPQPVVTIAELPERPPSARNQRRSAAIATAGLGLFGLRRIAVVGRDAERALLWDALRGAVEERQPRLALLRGPAGVGKTCLVDQLCTTALETDAARVFRAEHGRSSGPMDGLIAMVERGLRCTGLDRVAVAGRVVAAFRGFDNADAVELVELLRPDADARPTTGIDGWRVIARLLTRIAQQKPVILCLEDVHWSEEAAGFGRYLMEANDLGAVMVVVTTHEDVASPSVAALERDGRTTVIPVEPLDATHTRELVRRTLGLADRLADRIESRSEGNPLFVVQLVGDLIERGVIEPTEGGFDLVSGESLALPAATHDIWVGRVERVLADRSVAERHALERAALLGRTVVEAEWSDAADCDIVALTEALADSGLFRATGDDTWSFAHGMLAESLEQRAQEGGRLQQHLERCGRTLADRARADGRAGRLRGAAVTHRRASTLFSRAGDAESALRATIDEAEVRCSLGYIDEARASLEAARDKATELGADALVGRAWAGLARAHSANGLLEQAREHYLQAMSWYERAGERRSRANALASLGSLCQNLGRLDEGLSALNEALEVFREVGDDRHIGRVQSMIASQLGVRARDEEAVAAFDRALLVHRRHDDRLFEAISLSNRAGLLKAMGRLEEARDGFAEAIEILQEMGHRRNAATGLNNLGIICLDLGQVDDAERHLNRALEEHRSLRSKDGVGIALSGLAAVAEQRGEVLEALRWGEEALTFHRASGYRMYEALTVANQAERLGSLGRFEEAEAGFEQALHLLRELGQPRLIAITLSRAGRFYLDYLDFPRAREMLCRGMVLYREAPEPEFEAACRASLAAVELASGSDEAARRWAMEALCDLRQTTQPELRAHALLVLAELDAREGQPDSAWRWLEQASSVGAECATIKRGRIACASSRVASLLGDRDRAEASLAAADQAAAEAPLQSGAPLLRELQELRRLLQR